MSQQLASMNGQKVRAAITSLREDTSLWPAILVALGALFLLSLFPFYPPWLSALLAIACGAVAYFHPPAGTFASLLLAFPSVAYQSPIFMWVYGFVVAAIALPDILNNWKLISFLSIIICAPFAPFPLGLAGGFVQFGLSLAALYVGSRDSVYISIPSVLFILLLSTLWLAPNSAFLLTRDLPSVYGPASDVAVFAKDKAAPDLMELPNAAIGGLATALSVQTIFHDVGPAFSKVVGNLFTLLNPFSDSALIQLAAWVSVLFAIAYLPPVVGGKHKQVIASLALFLIPVAHLAISFLYGIEFPWLILVYTLLAIGAMFFIESRGIDLSRERLIQNQNKTKKFGKLGVEDMSDSEGPASMDAVGGYGDVKDELRESILAPLKHKELSEAYGIKPPAGILLFGPPGTGKTMLMRALSKELGIGFYYVKCSELLSEWYSESEKNVSELFSTARKNAPCILFFDEIDSLAKRRDRASNDDVGPRVMSTLLAEMDGFKAKGGKSVIVIGATNIPDQLDPAIMRPGRLDKIIYMHLPDKAAREAIFKVHLSKVPLGQDVDLTRLASMTERFSGADIANIVTEAIRLAAREATAKNVVVPISQKHLLSVLERIRPSTSLDSLSNYGQFRLDFERRSGAPPEEKKEGAVTFEDVVGLDDVRQALREAVEIPLLHPDLMKQYKLKPSRGLLLFGPPGCGKTMIVRAASHDLKATFLTLSGADLLKKGPANSERTLHEIFNRAREQPPALIFIDEIEALTPSRGSYSSPVLTQILQEMDGLVELKDVMVVGATNKPSQLDSAILRPGRFDKILYIPPPDAKAREGIFRKGLEFINPALNFPALSKMTEGFSGADIIGICQEAKMGLVRSRISDQAGRPGGADGAGADGAGSIDTGAAALLTQDQIEAIISRRRPSVTDADLMEYERFKSEYGERR